MSAQQVVGATGAGLVVLNFWGGPGKDTIAAGLFKSDSTEAQQLAAKGELTKLAGGVIFVAVAVILAGISATWAKGMTTVMLGIGLVWAINKYNGGGLK